MPRDVLIEASKSPSWRIVAAAAALVVLLSGGVFAAGQASGAIRDVEARAARQEEHLTETDARVSALEKANQNNQWNLYLVCKAQTGQADCKKPE